MAHIRVLGNTDRDFHPGFQFYMQFRRHPEAHKVYTDAGCHFCEDGPLACRIRRIQGSAFILIQCPGVFLFIIYIFVQCPAGPAELAGASGLPADTRRDFHPKADCGNKIESKTFKLFTLLFSFQCFERRYNVFTGLFRHTNAVRSAFNGFDLPFDNPFHAKCILVFLLTGHLAFGDPAVINDNPVCGCNRCLHSETDG